MKANIKIDSSDIRNTLKELVNSLYRKTEMTSDIKDILDSYIDKFEDVKIKVKLTFEE